MSRLEDLLREAYGDERFTMTVAEIEARAGRARRRRTTFQLAVAGALVIATTFISLVLPRDVVQPPVTWPTPSVAVTPSARPVSRLDECRQKLTKDGRTSLPAVAPVELIDGLFQTYIFSDGNAQYLCQFEPDGSTTSAIEPHLVTPLSRTAPQFTAFGDEDSGVIAGPVPYGMRQVDYFDGSGTKQLESNGTIFYGSIKMLPGLQGIKATAGDVFSATANLMRKEPATTRAAQQSLCREIQLRMPVPGTELTLLAAREVDSQTSALLLTAPDGLMALCDVFNGTGSTQVKFTIANHPIYDPLIERKDTTTSVHKAVVLVRRFSEDAGRGRVVLSNGQKVPLVFANGYATAWFDLPRGVHADHLEVDLKSGGRTDFPLPLR